MANWPTSRYPSSAETYEMIKENWSAKMLEATKSQLVCTGAFNSDFRNELALGDKVNIPVGANLSAGAVDVTSKWGGNLKTDFGTTATSITIDKWYNCPVAIDDGTYAQTQVTAIINKFGVESSYAVNKTIDTDVNGLFSSLTSTWAGSDGQTFDDDLCIALMEGLDEADIPRPGRKFLVDPSVVADMLKIDKFVNRDYNRTLTGEMGSTPYGDPILITNNLTAATTGSYCAYAHTDSVGIVIQKRKTVTITPEPDYYRTVVDTYAIWGADVLRSTFGAYFYSRKK